MISMRRAVPADKEAVTDVCLAVEPKDYVPELFDENVKLDPPSGIYVVELDGRVVGCHALDSFQPGTAFLYAMRVHPALQGQGIGRAYAGLQVEDAVRRGIRNLFLSSAPHNVRAHKTVERNGFVNRGPWFIYEAVPAPTVELPAGRARQARPEDAPLIAAFRERLAGEVMSEVVPAPDYPYGFCLMEDSDWNCDDVVVVEREGALEGAMMLRQSAWEGALYIRRLEGTPEAAAELLGFAAAWGRERGMTKWMMSLPTRCEHLLAPLGLDSEAAERWYIFHYRAE